MARFGHSSKQAKTLGQWLHVVVIREEERCHLEQNKPSELRKPGGNPQLLNVAHQWPSKPELCVLEIYVHLNGIDVV